MLNNVKIKTIVFAAISAAVLSACGGGGGSSPSAQLVNNAQTARSVIDQINALKSTEEITAADAPTVAAVQAAYNNLPAASKALVDKASVDKLEAAAAAVKTAQEGSKSADTAVIQAADAAVDAVKQKIAALPDSAAAEKQLVEAQQAFNALTEQQKTLITTAEKSKLDKLGKDLVTDHSPLAALNLPTPLHTSFIASASAQQNNPNTQLRKVDGKNDFTTNQGGLISSLASNANAEVKLDGVVINNSTTAGNATTVNFTTPYSMIAKAYSGGVSESDVSGHTGLPKGSEFAIGTANFDAELENAFKSLDAAKKALEKAEDAAARQAAQEEINKWQPVYNRYIAARPVLVDGVKKAADTITYTKKDNNSLVFDKRFDGVYIIQFTSRDGKSEDVRIVMHDPAAAGWTYQTFAHYVDPKNGVIHGYQTLGDETTFGTMPATGTATYNGLTTAYLVEGSQQKQLTADVKAVVDFAKKGVRFETANSQFHSVSNGVRTSSAAAAYNIKGNAAWGNTNHFAGSAQTTNGLKGEVNGKFYGAGAAEIGGTYGLKSDNAQLIGGYGAKRQ